MADRYPDGPEKGSCWNCRHYIEVVDTRRRDHGMHMVLGVCVSEHDDDGDDMGTLLTEEVACCDQWVHYAER